VQGAARVGRQMTTQPEGTCQLIVAVTGRRWRLWYGAVKVQVLLKPRRTIIPVPTRIHISISPGLDLRASTGAIATAPPQPARMFGFDQNQLAWTNQEKVDFSLRPSAIHSSQRVIQLRQALTIDAVTPEIGAQIFVGESYLMRPPQWPNRHEVRKWTRWPKARIETVPQECVF